MDYIPFKYDYLVIYIGLPLLFSSKQSPCSAGDARDMGLILGWEDPLEKSMATHSSIFA